jgi:hypothetical protein
MKQSIFGRTSDFLHPSQPANGVQWPGGRGILCISPGTTFTGGALINVYCIVLDEATAGTPNFGAPSGISAPISAPGMYVFDAPACWLQFDVSLGTSGDRLQLNDNIFVETL